MTYANGGTGRHTRHSCSRRFLVLTLAIAALGAACAQLGGPDFDASSVRIVLLPATGTARPATVAVQGLGPRDLSALRDAHVDDAAWQAMLRVTVADASVAGETPAVIGKYAVAGDALTFTPQFPFDAGRSYRVALDPARLPRAHQAAVISTTVGLPAVATTPTTVVTAVYPASAVVPENLLRMYIEFSAPMGSRGPGDFVRLVDITQAKEEVVEGAFLPVEADFWSPDHTRYTMFLDPGRVKLGILPNRMRGRPLVAGHRYALEILPGWIDANRLPLKAGYRHPFRAVAAAKQALNMADWRIVPPAAGSRDALVVTFPRPIDHAVVMRALGVEEVGQGALKGTAAIEEDDTRWRFAPAAAWQGGTYSLVAFSYLEDPQGNQIGRAFEEVEDQPKDQATPEAYRVAFTIKN